jgi:N-acetylglucosaminyldiphosphoundecaprenol N-acetyl-beta-D-mannosaminyltransferase
MRKLLIILGVPIDDLTMPEAIDRIESFIADGRQSQHLHLIATVNADFVVKSLKDPELRLILQEADMATADGMPLVWGARKLGVPLEGRVTGADLVPALAERAAQKGYSIYLLGAAPGIAAKAADVLTAKYPGLKIVGVVSPPNQPILEMSHNIVDDINATRPDILLVAFGNPKQEKWIGMHARDLKVSVAIGVGGTLDFIAGKTKRAPEWMQQSGLEWIYRLLQEPRRLWKRYVVDMFGFGTFFVRQWWIMRGQSSPSPALPHADGIMLENKAIFAIEGRLDRGNLAGFVSNAEEALMNTPYLIVDMARATFIDSAAIGSLVALSKKARDAGGDLRLAVVPDPIKRTLALIKLDRFFEIDATLDQALTRSVSAPIETASHRVQQWSVIKLPRRVDAQTSPRLIEDGEAALADNVRLVLDFSETAFLASAGLAALLRLNRAAIDRSGQLRLAACSKDVVRVIEMVKLDKTLSLYATVQAAAM